MLKKVKFSIDQEIKNELIYKDAIEIVQKIKDYNFIAYFVGGFVRNLLLFNKLISDIDICTNAKPKELKKIFQRTIGVGEQFGVILIPKKSSSFEISTFRKDLGYSDGRHPNSIEFTDAEEDVKRRDFTMNGLLFDIINEEIIDFIDGIEDINNKIIRCIGNPFERYEEDKLRMLRSIRFLSTLSDFSIEPNTLQAIKDNSAKITIVSKERITNELKKILIGKNSKQAIISLHSTGLLSAIIPQLLHLSEDEIEKIASLIELVKPEYYEVAFCILLTPFFIKNNSNKKINLIINQLLKVNFRMNNTETDIINYIIENIHSFENINSWTVSKIKRFIRQKYFPYLLEFIRVYSRIDEQYIKIFDFLNENDKTIPETKRYIKPLVNGNDLIDFGLKPDPLFSKILDEIEDLQLEDKMNTREEAIDYIKKNYCENNHNKKKLEK